MKKNFLICLLIICLLVLSGCQNNGGNINNGANSGGNTQKLDHKVYKYMKISSSLGSSLLYSATTMFGDTSVVSNGDIYYNPCIIAEFDTNTGVATKAKFYAFFLDYSDDEWVNKAIERYNSTSSDYKKNYKNVKKGRVNDSVSYLSADLEINSYIYTQFIDSYLIKGQDIDRYKDEVFYSRLYNYASEPPHEEGENFFEESLEGIRIEWSDSVIKAY